MTSGGQLKLTNLVPFNATWNWLQTPYLAPELKANIYRLKHSSFTPKSDIWAVGALFYDLCRLINRENNSFHINHMKSGTLPRIPQKYSDKFSNIITKMLSYRPHDRPDASHLQAQICDITSRIMLNPGT